MEQELIGKLLFIGMFLLIAAVVAAVAKAREAQKPPPTPQPRCRYCPYCLNKPEKPRHTGALPSDRYAVIHQELERHGWLPRDEEGADEVRLKCSCCGKTCTVRRLKPASLNESWKPVTRQGDRDLNRYVERHPDMAAYRWWVSYEDASGGVSFEIYDCHICGGKLTRCCEDSSYETERISYHCLECLTRSRTQGESPAEDGAT
jgi:hypothetical protein